MPLVLIAVISLRPDLRGGVLASFPPTLDQYRTLFEKPAYLRLFGTSVGMALAVAAAATVLAFPIAYFLAFRAGRHAGVFLALLLIPFWTSFLLRVMAWKVMLGSNGVINSFLLYTGLATRAGRVPALQPVRGHHHARLRLDPVRGVADPGRSATDRSRPLFEAAADLGSTPLRRFWRVVLPLSLPGVIAGFFTCFIPTVGEYVTPLLVGGSAGSMYGNLIQDFFTKAATGRSARRCRW